jgi:hypothetical protein
MKQSHHHPISHEIASSLKLLAMTGEAEIKVSIRPSPGVIP